jgi:deoxycytidylate deaminase
MQFISQAGPHTPAPGFRQVTSSRPPARVPQALEHTWFGQAADLVKKGAPLAALGQAAQSDVYFLRLIALARLANNQNERWLRQELRPETRELLRLFQVTQADHTLEHLSDVTRQGAHPGLDLTAALEQYLRNALNRSSWDFFVPAVSYRAMPGQKIIRQVTSVKKEVPLIFLWQMLHDLNVISQRLERWQSQEGTLLLDLCGPHLAEWRAHPKVQLLLAGFTDADRPKRLEIARSLTSLPEYPQQFCRQGVGAILVDAAEQVIGIGHNGPPLPQELRSDREVRGFDVYKIKGQEVKTPGMRRSICAEQKALLSAALNGGQLEDATIYSSLGPPCHQCLAMLINAGIKRIIYPLLGQDVGTSDLYADPQTEEILAKLSITPYRESTLGVINLRGGKSGRR